MSKLGDERIALIAEYARNYDESDRRGRRPARPQGTRSRGAAPGGQGEVLRPRAKALSPRTALRFLQVEHQLLLLIDLQIVPHAASSREVPEEHVPYTWSVDHRAAGARHRRLARRPTASTAIGQDRRRACSSAATANPSASCSTTAGVRGGARGCRWPSTSRRESRRRLRRRRRSPRAEARRPSAAASGQRAGRHGDQRSADAGDRRRRLDAGQTFKAIVDDPVMIDGAIVIPRGASAVVQAVDGRAVREHEGQRQDHAEAELDWLRRRGVRRRRPATSRPRARAKARKRRARSPAARASAPSSAVSPAAARARPSALAVGGAGGAVMASAGEEHLKLAAETRLQFQLSAAINSGRNRHTATGYAAFGRQIPSLAIRVSSVVGLSPSRSAAPLFPRMRQPALSSTVRMCAFSTSTSFALCATEVTEVVGITIVSRGSRRQNHRALDDVAKLADVAGPRDLLQCGHVLGAKSRRWAF